jgi:hypothetical protein
MNKNQQNNFIAIAKQMKTIALNMNAKNESFETFKTKNGDQWCQVYFGGNLSFCSIRFNSTINPLLKVEINFFSESQFDTISFNLEMSEDNIDDLLFSCNRRIKNMDNKNHAIEIEIKTLESKINELKNQLI